MKSLLKRAKDLDTEKHSGTTAGQQEKQSRKKDRKPEASVVDLFCDVGGLSHGFKLESFRLAAGIDIDEACRYRSTHRRSH
jgi:DNA (cytosine-5)-methyltransferase 1